MSDQFNGNNQQQRFSVNTSMVSMFDDQGVQLRLGGMDNAMSIAIWLPVPKENGRNSYPVDHRFNFVLAPERVAALDFIIQDQILPAMANGQTITKGIFTNRSYTNMIQIGVEDDGVYLYLYSGINEDRIPTNTYRFHFDDFMVVNSYNAATGEYALDKCLATFYLFTQCIHAFVTDSGHAARVANRYTTDKIFDYLKGVANALHVVVQSNSYSSGGAQSGSGFMESVNQMANSASAIQEADSLNNLLM